jgi:hypothetical protein
MLARDDQSTPFAERRSLVFASGKVHLCLRAIRRLLTAHRLTALALTLLGASLLTYLATHQSEATRADRIIEHQAGNIPAGGVGLTISPGHIQGAMAEGMIGLSIEADQLDTMDVNAHSKSLVLLMRRLGPGVLRVGGSSLDYSWWTSDGERAPGWATSVATPNQLRDLRRLLSLTGWRAILGVDLGHFDPERAASEARVAQEILGPRLLGVEVGNEPNDYGSDVIKLRSPTYDVSEYLKEVTAYADAIGDEAPGIRLYGPDLSAAVSAKTWLPVIASDKGIAFAAITEHYYPTSYDVQNGVCEGSPIPSALGLLSPQTRARENAILQGLVAAGQAAGSETRVSETNTTSSCDTNGGPATSPVFASALWALDWSLRSATSGVEGINFHGSFGVCRPNSFSPLCAPTLAAAATGRVTPRPEYYGLLAARELEGGSFLAVALGGEDTETLTAYATLHADGVITVAIDNFAAHGSRPVLLTVPGYSTATEESLIGPAIGATSGITFGHASFNPAKGIRPLRTPIARASGAFRLALQPDSAIIISLRR